MRRAALTDVSALPIHILIWFLPDLPLRTIVLSAANGAQDWWRGRSLDGTDRHSAKFMKAPKRRLSIGGSMLQPCRANPAAQH